jgi:hypothetical protein
LDFNFKKSKKLDSKDFNFRKSNKFLIIGKENKGNIVKTECRE